MKSLPLKYKKQIVNFCRTYEALANPHKVRIVIPKKELVVRVYWDEDNRCTVDYNDIERSLRTEDVYESTQINSINREIKSFIEKTRQFGKKHFGYSDWLWENVLWDYRPESGQKFRISSVKWIKDYEISN